MPALNCAALGTMRSSALSRCRTFDVCIYKPRHTIKSTAESICPSRRFGRAWISKMENLAIRLEVALHRCLHIVRVETKSHTVLTALHRAIWICDRHVLDRLRSLT